MKCSKVRSRLDDRLEKPSKDGFSAIRLHAENCAECRHAYRSRFIADSLVQARAAENLGPSPFFAARVMNALREGRSVARPSFVTAMWQQAGVALGSIMAVVVILASLTLFTGLNGQTAASSSVPEPAVGSYSAEQVVMGDGSSIADESVSSAQVVDTVFNSGD